VPREKLFKRDPADHHHFGTEGSRREEVASCFFYSHQLLHRVDVNSLDTPGRSVREKGALG